MESGKLCWEIMHKTHSLMFTRQFSISTAFNNTLSKILLNTKATKCHLTPEIKLNLITKYCYLWTARLDECPFTEPYWAFYWPGGQVLTRYLLDNPQIVRDKSVIDIGSGCGAAAIASALCGAKLSTANDIDEVAACAISHNAAENRATLDVSTTNVIGSTCTSWDTMLIGDMFYDEDFSRQLVPWLRNLRLNGKTILIGDPGRHAFQNGMLKDNLELLKSYELPASCIEENRGLTTGQVWMWK